MKLIGQKHTASLSTRATPTLPWVQQSLSLLCPFIQETQLKAYHVSGYPLHHQ